MNTQCRGGSSFAKQTRALKMRRAVASHWKLTTTTESKIKADPLTTTGEAAKELNVNHSMVIWHLKQIGKVKKLDKQVPHELTASPKKSPFFEVLSSLIPHNNNEPFLDWITTCDEKRILYNSW